MDPLDSLDIPFADEDPTIPVITPITNTSTIPAPQTIIVTSVSGAGDAKTVAQEEENVCCPPVGATLPEDFSQKNPALSDTAEIVIQEAIDDLTDKTASEAVEDCFDVKQEAGLQNKPDLINTANQDSVQEDFNAESETVVCEVSGNDRPDVYEAEETCEASGVDEGPNEDLQTEKDGLHDAPEESSVTQTPDILLQVSEKESGSEDVDQLVPVAEVCVAVDGKTEDAAPDIIEVTQAPAVTRSEPQENEPSVGEEHTTQTVSEQTEQTASEQFSVVDSSKTMMMDMQGETHGGKTETSLADDLVDDFFGTTASSETVTNGIQDGSSECILRIDESIDDSSSSRPRLNKESSPEIIVGSVDSVENVTLKDATSEKALLSNGDDEGICSQRDSLSSRTDEDKRKSSSDMDMDFAVLELDASHLNLDMSKQKTSLRKKGSLARRKKPSRGSITHGASDSSDSMFQDSTDSKPVVSPTSDMAEDDVFHKHATASESQDTGAPSGEGYTVRKAAQPFKPSLIMPGLQDLSQSKLFNQERKKSGESPTSPVKSPLSVTSPVSPTHKPVPPVVLPKPTTKGQKDSQNKTIAAENCSSQSADSKSVDSNDVSNNVITASVEEAVVVPNLNLSDSASSFEGPNPIQGDGGSLSGPRPGRTDSWSSVSSPRRLSRGNSVSSVEGGEAGSITTPRRASIQGSAYAPIGFRPRRSSSIVLDSNNKLVDVVPPQSPSPTSSSASAMEEDSEALISSGIKSPIYKPPVWLSEIKAKTGAAAGEPGTRLRSTSAGSNDGSVSVSSTRSRNNSESAGSVDSQSVSDAGSQKKQEEEEPEKPSWMKAADQNAALTAEKSPVKKEVEENGEEEDKKPVPPWAAELKKKNRPAVAPKTTANGKMFVAPYKSTNDKESAPVISSGRDEYSPSWMKSSQQVKKPPPPVVPSKPVVTIGSKPAVKTTTNNPMKQYETPKWKLDLAEKKKRREAEMMPAVEESGSENVTSDSMDTNGSSSSSDVPQWRRQLSLRKKQRSIVKEDDAPTEDAKSGPNWAAQAEERRARLMKSGLFDQADEEGEAV